MPKLFIPFMLYDRLETCESHEHTRKCRLNLATRTIEIIQKKRCDRGSRVFFLLSMGHHLSIPVPFFVFNICSGEDPIWRKEVEVRGRNSSEFIFLDWFFRFSFIIIIIANIIISIDVFLGVFFSLVVLISVDYNNLCALRLMRYVLCVYAWCAQFVPFFVCLKCVLLFCWSEP